MKRFIGRAAFFSLCLASLVNAQPPATTQTICGWVDNPTPNNWWITDRHAEWTISEQGRVLEYDANGNVRDCTDWDHCGKRIDPVANMPRFPDRKKYWLVTNGSSYGFGCACLTTTVDEERKQILTIAKSRVLPISQCRHDPNLPQKNWRAPK